MAITIQLRRDTEANWLLYDPVLAEGELAFTLDGTDAGRAKLGDGTSTWSELDYATTGTAGGGGAVDSVNGQTGVVVLSAADVGAYEPGGTDVAVADGGTGASTAAGARTNLGLGSAATAATSDFDAAGAAAAAAAASIAKSLVDAKGDLIVATAADTVARLAAGADGDVLTVDSAQAAGVKWSPSATSTTLGPFDTSAGAESAFKVIGHDRSADPADLQYLFMVNKSGNVLLNTSLTISGGIGDPPPAVVSGTPSMLAIWSDVAGPAVVLRTNSVNGPFLAAYDNAGPTKLWQLAYDATMQWLYNGSNDITLTPSAGVLTFAGTGVSAAGTGLTIVYKMAASQSSATNKWTDSSDNLLGSVGPQSGSNTRLRQDIYLTQESSPTNYERLEIRADSTNSAFRIESAKGGTGSFRDLGLMSQGGKVGIGKINPSEKLDVAGGNINIDAQRYISFGGTVAINDDTTNTRLIFGGGYAKVDHRISNSLVMSLTSTALTLTDAVNLAVGTTTGTKIGTATTQKLGFWNATPVVQQARPTDTASIISLLVTLGLCA